MADDLGHFELTADDVIREISSFLSFEDFVHLSQTSNRMRQVVSSNNVTRHPAKTILGAIQAHIHELNTEHDQVVKKAETKLRKIHDAENIMLIKRIGDLANENPECSTLAASFIAARLNTLVVLNTIKRRFKFYFKGSWEDIIVLYNAASRAFRHTHVCCRFSASCPDIPCSRPRQRGPGWLFTSGPDSVLFYEGMGLGMFG